MRFLDEFLSVQIQSVKFVMFSFFFNLFAEQKVSDNRVFEGRNWKQGTTACPDPVNDNVINVCVAWASPLEAGAQNRIEISARIIECFKIENWNEYNDQPRDVMMMPEQDQTFKFFTSNNKWCSDEAVESGCVFWILLTQSLRGQSTEKSGDAFNDCSSQRWHLQERIQARDENHPSRF